MPTVVHQVKTEVVTEIKTEVKTEVIEPDYPNYMESIETVINASKKALPPKPAPAQAAAINQLPYHDHQYSRITFYGSGQNDTTETKAQESVKVKEEEKPTQVKTKMPKRSGGTAQTLKTAKKPRNSEKKPRKSSVKKLPRQKPHQVVRPQPIIYRFEPPMEHPTPAYFMPSISSTPPAHTVIQHTPHVVRATHKLPSMYANTTLPLHLQPINFVQGSVIQQPIYYLVCNPQE